MLLCFISLGMNILAFYFFLPACVFSSLVLFVFTTFLFFLSPPPLFFPLCYFCFVLVFLSSLFQVFLSPSGFPTGWIKMVQLCPAPSSSSSSCSGRVLLRCWHCQPPVSSSSQRMPPSATQPLAWKWRGLKHCFKGLTQMLVNAFILACFLVFVIFFQIFLFRAYLACITTTVFGMETCLYFFSRRTVFIFISWLPLKCAENKQH